MDEQERDVERTERLVWDTPAGLEVLEQCDRLCRGHQGGQETGVTAWIPESSKKVKGRGEAPKK